MYDEKIIEDILNKISSNGASYGDVRIENSFVTLILVSNGKIEKSSTGVESGVGIRVLKDGSWGFAFGPIEKWPQVVDMAFQVNKMNSRQKRRDITLAEVKPVKDKFEGEQKKSLLDVSLEEKIQLTRDANKALEHERVAARKSIYREMIKRQVLATTEGTLIEYNVPHAMLYNASTAKKNGKMIEGVSLMGHLGGYELFDHEDPIKIARKATERAIQGLELKSVKPGKYPVVVDGNINHLFAHEACGHSAEGDFVMTAGVFRGKLGKKVASPIVDLVDDGSLMEVNGIRSFGYLKYDDEGVPSSKTYIIKEGVLNSYLTDRDSAAYFDLEPTGNARAQAYYYPQIVRMTNTFITTSKNSMKKEELLELVKNGYLLKQGTGGQTDPVKGTFNFGVLEVYRVENGEIKEQYMPTTIAGNTLDTLRKIIGISNEFENPMSSIGFCGKSMQNVPVGVTAGWMAIKSILIGG